MIKKIFYPIVYALLFLVPLVSFVKFLWKNRSCSAPVRYKVKMLKALPRAEDTFTQGLFLYKDHFYESYGQYGFSGIKKYKLGEPNSLLLRNNSDNEFAEGLAIWKDQLIQITWKAQKAYVYDLGFEKQKEFFYEGEGWGLTQDDTALIMSNGSHKIRFRSPEDFSVLREIEIKNEEKPVKNLNELEYIKNEIFANIWMSDEIVSIDPQRGCVTRQIDASSLWQYEDRSKLRYGGYLNGIAYHPELGHIYLTGKYWKHIYQVELKKL